MTFHLTLEPSNPWWGPSERERLRDTFAAAALTGLLADDGDRTEHATPNFTARAYEWADAMLRERERTNHDAVPEAIARTDSASCGWRGCGGTDKPVTLPAVGTGNTTLDGAPAAEAGAGKPQISHPQAGNTQTAPPCVETDGPPSKGEGLHISDSRTRLSEAEIDALEYVVEEGRIASMDDYGILRSLLVRVRPEWETADSVSSFAKPETDSPHPVEPTPPTHATPGEGKVQGEGTVAPAAWLAVAADGSESSAVYMLKEQAEAAAREWGWFVAPLYALPVLRAEDEIAIEAAWGRTGLTPTWPADETGCGVKYANAMADEIMRLRAAIRRLADQDATLSVQGGNVTVTIDAKLTSEEREAVTYFSDYGETPGELRRASTLRSLLERLK
jgi:hypothetical protein